MTKQKFKKLKSVSPDKVVNTHVHSRTGVQGVVKSVAPTVGADNSHTIKIQWVDGSSIFVHLEDCDQIFID